jgi:DNA replication protein DnaC
MNKKQNPLDEQRLQEQLSYLRLPYMLEHYSQLASYAATHHQSPLQLLAKLVEGEADHKRDRSIQWRIKQAGLPLIKDLADVQWNWPTSINREHIKDLFRLQFIPQKQNVIFVGGVGVGKTHLAIALAHAACHKRHSVLFSTAVEIVHTLTAAQPIGEFKNTLKKYTRPELLVIDELGYLPIDKFGADCLFQVISTRYEKAPTIITTNKPYKKWSELFANDSTLASAVLDRLLHHAQTILIEGQSFRMKDRIKEQA